MAITNTDEFLTYSSFNVTGGVTTSDTFNTWRKKTNGIINAVDGLSVSIANISVTNIQPEQFSLGAPTWTTAGALQTYNNGAGSFKAGSIVATSLNVGTGSITAGSFNTTGTLSSFGTLNATSVIAQTINSTNSITAESNIGIGITSPLGKLHIVEQIGSLGTSNVGSAPEATIILDHENAGGASSILFRSKANRAGGDAGYIRYQDSNAIGAGGELSRLIIGVTNDSTTMAGSGDALILNPPAFVGDTGDYFVGIGIMDPTEKLHVAGNVRVSGSIVVGTTITASGDIVGFSTSDRKFKDNIANITDPLDKVSQINGVTFDWNDQQSTFTGPDIGVIAQEVEAVLPEIVCIREDGSKAVKYDKMVALLIECVKELKCEIEELKLLIK